MTDAGIVRIDPFLDGEFRVGQGTTVTIDDKFTGAPAAEVSQVSSDQVEAAVGSLVRAQATTVWPVADRSEVLTAASVTLRERSEAFARLVVADTGFTITDARREVSRAADTLQLCAEEARRLVGEVVPVSGVRGQENRVAFTTYHPRGVVCAITPFNSPLNTVTHKVGPALAAGNAVLLKPATQTPQSADALVRLLLEVGLPAGLVSVVYGGGSTVGTWLARDERLAYYAFTGSTEVGRTLQSSVGLRPTQLELGSLSSTLITASADLGRAVELCVNAGFRKAGQVCTSIQRLYVEQRVLDDVAERLAKTLGGKVAGDPSSDDTFVGPLIAPAEADRVCGIVEEAVADGARLAYGGGRAGNVLEPTVVADVPSGSRVMREEIFGPVVVLRGFDALSDAVEEVNDTPFGLAAGVFTESLNEAMFAAQALRMGSVHINETSSSRLDLMPYAGVKDSGHGTEGPRYAVREMSEQRLVSWLPTSPMP
ncbi:aldehyde dehydrogenase family protein [Intrasporangium mesophilum]